MNQPTYRVRPVAGGHVVSFEGPIKAKSHFVSGSRERAEQSGKAHLEAHAMVPSSSNLEAQNLAAIAKLTAEIEAFKGSLAQVRTEREKRASARAELDRKMGLATVPTVTDTPYLQTFSVVGRVK